MRHALFLISSIAATGLSSFPAQAQWANYGGDDSIVRCESIDGRSRHCATDGGDAQLVRQLSRSACIRGRTWGASPLSLAPWQFLVATVVVLPLAVLLERSR